MSPNNAKQDVYMCTVQPALIECPVVLQSAVNITSIFLLVSFK